ncbi:hypothetical protein [Polaribacter cellanae]|uniref:Uncharacterized protein n=1 Tax=Polaribacter cellanae TaxID=2818493 RepID=A0A975CMF7_9FLAO|nr:hypothetical protein [Polaribacter cellanae]QTE22328.1 hypothetical protein J3359_16205 [Polaribacter cellanae]
MKQLFLKTTLFLFALTLSNCEKNDPQEQLPPITQIGANTFGAIVNGSVFITKDKTGYSPPGGGTPKGLVVTVGSSLPDYEYFGIDARNYEGVYIYIYIPKKIPQEITYSFKNSTGVRASLEKPDFPHLFCSINGSRYLSYENSGSITFSKVNLNKGIYAGTFNVKLKNMDDEKDIIEITNGRFDI